MNWLLDLMAREIAGCALWRIVAFFLMLLAALVAGRLARFFMEQGARRSEKREKQLASLFLDALARPVSFLGLAAGVWLGTAILTPDLGEGLRTVLEKTATIIYAATFGYAIYKLVDIVDYYLARLARSTDSKVDDMLVPLVGKSIRITVLVLVVIQVAHAVSGRSITSVLAGLGVGGLAVALAGQDTIKNLFGSLVILGDKPFEIGDRIIMDGHDGPVEDVGFRSTKIRTLEGHLVTVPNAEMVNRTIQNVGKRPYIRRLANITITYDTPPAKVRRAVEILKEILKDHEGMRPEFPPRVYFSDFNDCSLNILMIYWYHPPEYWKYMEYSERVNQQILERFNSEGIDFAFPSQTVYLANDDKRQLALKMLQGQS